MSLKLHLYHSVESTCAQKVRIVLAEKDLPWHETRLNLRQGDQFNPEYLKLNPKAVVPTLVHDDRVIRESSVINEYLDDCFPDSALRPTSLYDRSRMRLLIKTIDDEAHPAIGILSYAVFLRHQMNELKSPDELAEHFNKVADPARRERQMKTHEEGLRSPAAKSAINSLHKVISLLDAHLGENPWLAGQEFSLADAAALPYIFRARAINVDGLWEERANFQSWLTRGIDRVENLALDEPWGSASFHEMVAHHADSETKEIQKMVKSVG
ncbi:MAG: glutathione S-transferase family protein [Pseudomonadales bacterium]